MRVWMMLLALLTPSVMAEDRVLTGSAKAILAGGCFWCVESDMMKLDGVTGAVSGYSGGTIENPTYENYHDEIAGTSPHVEVVEVTYDPAKLSYGDLLAYFLRHIDPTDGGGQFCDRGAAYRPVIFTANMAETEIAKSQLEEGEKVIRKPVNVDILPANRFWAAEEYHQDYAMKNPTKYSFYRWNCGRDAKVKEVWGK